MRLIVEKDEHGLYVYRESEKQFRAVDSQRGPRLDPSLLAEDCDLANMPEGYFVFKIKKIS